MPSICTMWARDGHEYLGRGQRGSIEDPENVLAACPECHDFTETHRDLAAKFGLKTRRKLMNNLHEVSPGLTQSARMSEMLAWRKESFDQLAAAQAIAAEHGMKISNDGDLAYHIGTPKGEVSWYPATRLADTTDLPIHLSNAMAVVRPCPTDLLTCLQLIIIVLAAAEQAAA